MVKYKEENLIGKRFGRLVVEKEVRINNLRYFSCKCDCGKEKLVRFGNLVSKAVQSCGCLRKEIVKENAKKMGVKNRKEMFCKICGKNHYAKGLCKNCYERDRRYRKLGYKTNNEKESY